MRSLVLVALCLGIASAQSQIATNDGPPGVDLDTALHAVHAYATRTKLDTRGTYLQAGVYDARARRWVFDWISPQGNVGKIVYVDDRGVVTSP